VSNRKLTVEEILPLILSAAGALGVLPFAVIRFMQGEFAVGLLDVTIVAGFSFLGYFVYRTRHVRVASVLIAFICLAGVLSTVYLNGPGQVYWAYPAMLVAFYLLRVREAIVVCLLTTAALVPPLVPVMDPLTLATVVVTLIVTNAIAYAFATISRDQRDKLMALATRDALTGAGNRWALQRKLAEIIAAQARYNLPASMLLIDLDHFKQINDAYGHAMGDRILVNLTEIINLRIRVTDSLYRIGGEEFVVVIEGQDLQKANHLAEQLRTLVEANELAPNRPVTISLGVAELGNGESAADWLRRADEALYRAKRAGRNLTSVAYA
jgi:diguanylate cyclase (GGDEF)-like protein